MSDNYDGVQRTINNSQSPLQLFKGPESKIKTKPLTDGALYFATDSKKIYLDCDFEDSEHTQLHDRLAFGGSSGIFYAAKEFSEVETNFKFSFNELEGVIDVETGAIVNMPKVDDMILNDTDGSFFRVTNINEAFQEIETKRLTVAGNGSGGGGSGGAGGGGTFFCRLARGTASFAKTAATMPISYIAYSDSGIEGITNSINIEFWNAATNKQLFTLYNVTTSSTSEEIVTYDIKRYIEEQIRLGVLYEDRAYNLVLRFTDGMNTSNPQPLSFCIATMSLVVASEDFTDPTTDYTYGIIPQYNQDVLKNPYIEYQVIDQKDGRVYQTGTVENLSPNVGSTFNVTYQKGRPVTVVTQLVGNINNVEARSKTCSQSFTFVDPNNPVLNIVILSWPEAQEYETYTTDLVINYRVSYGAQQVGTLDGTLEIYRVESGSEVLYNKAETEFAISKKASWTPYITDEGTYRFKIVIGHGASQQSQTSPDYVLKGISGNVPIVTTASLQFNFVPKVTYTTETRDKWSQTWLNPATGQNQEVSAQFQGFNWVTNGWEPVNSSTAKLVLNNQAKLVIPISPFYGANLGGVGSYSGATATGKTIEFDVKISNIRDRKQRIITCASQDANAGPNDEPSVGIIATGDYFVLTGSDAYTTLTDISADGIVSNSINGLVAHYSADERVHICYVIAPTNQAIDSHFPANFIYTYVNGVLSGIVENSNGSIFRQDGGKQNRIIFDSTYADIELYNFRFYGTALSAEAVLDNYLASLSDIDTAIARKAENNIISYKSENNQSYTAISLNRVIETGTIPYLVLRGGYRCDKSGSSRTQSGDNAEICLPYFDKKDYRYMEAYFVDPLDESKCFGIKDPVFDDKHKIIDFTSTTAERWKVTVYPQGTSSLEYPVKNLRVKTINKQQKYQLFPNTPPCRLFTFKADYMDSSMSHNTGTANQLNDLYASAGIPIDPQKRLEGTNNPYAQYNLLTAIMGRPCVIFYHAMGIEPKQDAPREDTRAEYEYIGRYNFNFDKGEPELFGFFEDEENKYGITLNGNNEPQPGYAAVIKDEEFDPNKQYYIYQWNNDSQLYEMARVTIADADAFEGLLEERTVYYPSNVCRSIQCWEMKNNNNNLTSFRTPWDDKDDLARGYSVWEAAYESRYPEYVSEKSSDKRAFGAFLNWLASTNLLNATGEALAQEDVITDTVSEQEFDPITGDPLFDSTDSFKYKSVTYTYDHDTPEYRLAKFKKEAPLHLDIKRTAFYYIITELEVLMDSRAKNMMMVSYTANNETGDGIWYPIFYDMDTAMGVNNRGKIVHRYDVKDTTFGVYNTTADYPRLPNGDLDPSQRYSSEYSVLWANFRLVYAQGWNSEVAKLYRTMRGGDLNLDFLLNTYNNKLANAWNETFINQDEWYKFIRARNEINWEYDSKGNHKLIDPSKPDVESNWKVRQSDDFANWAELIYVGQGTRTEHRKQWLKRRMRLLDGKYADLNHAFAFGGRFNYMAPYTIENGVETETNAETYNLSLTADDTSYVWVNFKNMNSLNAGAPYGPIYIKEGTQVNTELLSRIYFPNNEQEGRIWFCSEMVDMGNFSAFGLASVSAGGGENSPQFKLRTFDNSYTAKTQAKFNNFWDGTTHQFNSPWTYFSGTQFPLMEELNLDYMNKFMTGVNVSDNKYLRRVSARHSEVSEVILPTGGVLNYVALPECIVAMKVKDQPLLDTVICDNANWPNLSNFQVTNCPALDSKTIFKAAVSNVNSKLSTIELIDLNWEFDPTDPTECTLEGNMITSLPLIEKMLYIKGPTTDAIVDGDLTANRYYVTGTIKINTGTQYGFDAIELLNKYLPYYPNLQYAWDSNEYVTGAKNFSFVNADGTALPEYDRMYATAELSTMTAADLFTGCNMADFDKSSDGSYYDYRVVGFKLSGPNDSTELFVETPAGASNPVTLEQATASAQRLCQIYITDNEFSFAPQFDFSSLEGDYVTCYPVYVGEVHRYNVNFYDGDGVIFETHKVRYSENTTPPNVPAKIELPANDLTAGYLYLSGQYNAAQCQNVRADVDCMPTYDLSNRVDIRSAIAANYFSQFFTVAGNKTYTTGNGVPISGLELSISKNYQGKAICVPKQYQGANVVILGVEKIGNVYQSNHTLKRVFFEDGANHPLKLINTGCFTNSTELEYFDFNACSNLIAVGTQRDTYDNRNVDAQTGVFAACVNLQTVNQELSSQSLVEIGKYAFYGCAQIKFVKLSGTLTTIYDNAFNGCIGLGTNGAIEIQPASNNWSNICNRAFFECTNLHFNVTEFAHLRNIGSNAFQKCTSFTIFTGVGNKEANPEYNEVLETVGGSAFQSAGDIGWYYMPPSLQTIGSYAFDGTTVHFNTIVGSVLNVDSAAFSKVQFETGNGDNLAWTVNKPANGLFPNYDIKANIFSQCTALPIITLNLNHPDQRDAILAGTDGLPWTTYWPMGATATAEHPAVLRYALGAIEEIKRVPAS